ncbi:MAG: hypothetical protein WBV22_04845 [Anaerolineaceae bacterium]
MKRTTIATILILFLLASPSVYRPAQAQTGDNYVCGSLEQSEQPTQNPDPYSQNVGNGPVFKPYGWTDQSQWLFFHYLGVYVQATGTYEFFGFPDVVNIKIWDPQLSGDTVYQISSYELVDSCGPQVSFYAEREGITAGECTNIYWQVDNVANLEGVYFNGDSVDAYSAAQVCPLESTHYQLEIRSYDNWSNSYYLRIYVAPQPTIEPYQPPTIAPPPRHLTNHLPASRWSLPHLLRELQRFPYLP